MDVIEQMLQALTLEAPCGEDIAFSPEVDAIAKARVADDPSLEQGAWVTTLKEADWKFVGTRCAQLIETRSKDLHLAVWLTEARAKTHGMRGLGEGLQLVAGLCQRYWEQVHPQADEDGFEQRIGNLCWIAARAPQLMRELALTEGTTGFSMIDVEAARARGGAEAGADIDGARKRSSRGFYQALLADMAFCLEAIGALEAVVDERLGADGPGFSAARAALQDVSHYVTQSAREVGALVEPAPAGAAVPMVAGETMAGEAVPLAGRAAPAGPLQTRAQALAQLRAVADFFRRTEPHSPVAYLAEKAAAWGEQPLHVWLRTVVKDAAVCGQLEELLGVQDAP